MPTRGPLNPYSVGSPVSGEVGFYGRDDLVETVVKTLTATRQNAITLYGQRRIGKSSLLHRLRRDEALQQDHLPVFFDLQLYKGFSPTRILVHLAQEVIDKHNLNLSPPDEAELSGDYRQFQRVFLSKVYPHLAQKRLLLFFDEFDVAVPLNTPNPPPEVTLFDYLEPLIEAEKQRLAFIFVVGERLTSLSEGYRHLFKGVRTQPVGRLGQQDTYDLLTGLGKQGNIRYSDEALAEIWALTNGHPYLTQLIGSEVFDHLQKQQTQEVLAADVLACLDRAMEHGQGGLGWFWIGFKPEEQLILSAVAELTDHQQAAGDAEIAETLRRRQLFLNNRNRRQAYKPLIDGDFLLEAGSRRYQFTVEFIRRWVVKHYPLKQAQTSEAEHYFHQGLQAYDDGDIDKAIENYRQALTHNPYFAGPQLALAKALRAHAEIPAAIAEYEKAYQLDPAGALQGLIELRLSYAHDLQNANDDEGALKQARCVLKIDDDHIEARQLLSDIYLRQAEASLQAHNLAQALSIAQTLLKSVPLTQDNLISQRLRNLWLKYSQKWAQQKLPDWGKAQATLDDLKTLGLQDETVKTAYNQLILDRVDALLKQDDLPLALSILISKLKPPWPASRVKSQLLDYSRRQVARRRWSEAESALKALVELGDDEEGRTALLRLYHEWGDSYQEAEKFDEAIEIYRQGEIESDTFAFKQKIADVYLRRAAQSLDQYKLATVEASYRYALAVLNTEAVQRQIQGQLEAYLNKLWEEQDWLQGIQAGEILQALHLTGTEALAWQTKFHLKQAQVELEQGFQEAAFQRLGSLGAGARPEIKILFKNYLQRQAQYAAWETGNDILQHLAELLADDPEITTWQANWLFLWARALSEDKADKNLTQAGTLCQQSLALASEEMPSIDFLAKAESQKAAADLRSLVCLLWIKILLAQTQACLKQNELSEAKAFFEEALKLPVQPTDLVATIESILETFSQWQVYQENWTQARNILKIGLQLDIPQRQFNELLTELTINQANLLFKHDEPNLAFSALNHLKSHSEEEEQHRIKPMVYRLSRLYAGRDRWFEARQALLDLYDWLAPAEKEVADWLDDLNWEHLEFIKARRQITSLLVVSQAEIERLQEEVQMAKEGYQDARKAQPKSRKRWAEAFIEASLALGQAYLGRHNLAAALEAYQQLLNLENLKAVHRAQISQSLYVYNQSMLDQENWEEARSALEALKSFLLPAPDGETRPDPRVDGAIQRVILSKAEALLKEDRVKEAFAQLHELPRPKPEGEIKEMILDYYVEEHCAQHDWPQAITALEQLDQFLAGRSEKTRDQEVLEWLIDRLKGWGQYLEKEGDLAQAVTIYDKALYYTRQTARPRSLELAGQRVRVTLQLAEADLERDPLLLETPPVIAQALQRYLEILALPECQPEYRYQIKKALHGHTFRLAEADQWSRAHQTLDYLNNPLFPRPTDQQRTLFTDWRRDLFLAEVRQHLAAGRINEAFIKLDGLKSWLEERDVPQATWLDNESTVKDLVNDFYQSWLQSERWEPAVQALERLGQLFPEDIELKGREVELLCQWGQSLRAHNDLAEALARYERALAKAPGQSRVTPARIEHELRDTQLAQAQQYLERDDLSAAVAVYEYVLEQSGGKSDYPPRIRQALKGYSDLLTRQSSPAWETAHQALNNLLRLKLNNEEVFEWRQNLILQEVAAWLEQDKLEVAFNRLTALENPWPQEHIWEMVRKYSQAQAEAGGWELAVEVLRRLGEILPEEITIRQRVFRALTALGIQLQTQRKLQGAEVAYRTALRFE